MPSTAAPMSSGSEGAVTADVNSPSVVATLARLTPSAAETCAYEPRAKMACRKEGSRVISKPCATSHALTRA